MIRSMTGFGMAEVSEETFTVRVELRSVNHRFLQTKIRVPAEHGELEPKVEALLKKGLIRGAVTVSVRIERALGVKDVTVNAAVVRRYQEEFRSLGDGQIDFMSIFSKLSQYGYDGWAVMEWECCIKSPEQGAEEGAPFIQDHIIQVTKKALDDFAGAKVNKKEIKSILGI